MSSTLLVSLRMGSRGLQRWMCCRDIYPRSNGKFAPFIFHRASFATSGSPASSVRIGCGSGFWGDTPTAGCTQENNARPPYPYMKYIPQLVKRGQVDFLVLDYLSEVTMSLLVASRRKMPELGWTPDFVHDVGPHLPEIKKKGIRVVTNAGGVNPASCMKALLQIAEKQNVTGLKIAVISGDDVLSQKVKLTNEQCPSPSTVASANAYLGAGPISRALDLGADIVITGRCTDSALALGPLIHSFKWDVNDFDLMAKGSLAGHLIECGAQATGGIFTDWEQVEGWEYNGFPIAVCDPNGDCTITKPDGTGGLINKGTVSEQLLYEIHDPSQYILPDVVCDFTGVKFDQVDNGVRVTGARGLPPTPFYKVGGTFQDGWKCTAVCPVVGPKALEKGVKTGNAIVTRCKGIFNFLKFPDFSRVHIQMLGTEQGYGNNDRQSSLESREGVLWLSVHHPERKALECFAKEIASAGTGMAPGLTAVVSGRPKPSPLLQFFSYLTPKESIQVEIEMSTGHKETYIPPSVQTSSASATSKGIDDKNTENLSGSHSYRLSELAYLRSGDKGDTCNIGVIARSPEIYPVLKARLTDAVIGQYFQHKFSPPGYKAGLCDRYELPGVFALNFVLKNSLGGGGIASLTPDPQGKGYAQQLADLELQNLPKLL